MREIANRRRAWAIVAGFAILSTMVILLFGETRGTLPMDGLGASLLIGVIAGGLWARESQELNRARLIAENPIMRIRTAVISDIPDTAPQPNEIETCEVIVSYFGILLGSRIIRFNQGDVRLQTVEIGEQYISVTYGTKQRTQTTWLLRPSVDSRAMQEISERFRYETGIVPTFVS